MASVMPSKPEQQKPVPIQELDISPDSLVFTQGKDAKNIKIKQFLCVRDVIPKTNLYQAILLENRSQDRHLQRTLSSLSTRQLKHANSFDRSNKNYPICSVLKVTRVAQQYKRYNSYATYFRYTVRIIDG